MAKGRPPDPRREKRGTGNRPLPGKRHVEVMPAAPGIDISPPPDIPEAAHELWHRVVAELETMGMHEADLLLVEMLIIAVHRHRQARAAVNKIGILVAGQKRPEVNPLLKVEKDTAHTYVRLCETLGLSPAARARLGLMHIAGQSMLVNIAQEVAKAVRDSRP